MRTILMILLFMNMCSEPGEKYHVRVLSSYQPDRNFYCLYKIESLDGKVLPKAYFLATCGKYKDGDEILIEINENLSK